MSSRKVNPGPVGKSCLTCRRRRKKCDFRRPTCDRCLKGHFECLGYDDQRGGNFTMRPEPLSIRPEPRTDDASGTQTTQHFQDLPALIPSCEKGKRRLTALFSDDTQSITLVSSASGSKMVEQASYINNITSDGNHQSCLHDDRQLPSTQTLSQSFRLAGSYAPQSSNAHPPTLVHNQLESLGGNSSQSLVPSSSWILFGSGVKSTVPSLSRNPPPVPFEMQTIVNFVMAQYERFLRLSFFNPGHWQVKTVRDDVSWRLQSSEIARWVLFMGAKIFESVLDGTSTDRITTFERWIIRMDDSVNTALSRRSTVAERQIQLTGQLELAFFKFRFTGGSNCYVIFRNSASIFLQMMFLDPLLWPNRTLPPYLGARISVAHALATTCYELGHFVILDAVCAMVYGLPQTVQYDTSTPAFKTHAYPIEWLHGCPPELLIVFAEINQRFAERYILGPVQPWDDLEQRLKVWEAPLRTEPREDSCKAVARLAIQEGWRQALLAYLYMSVCGLRSDDLRVRAAVQQIFRLIGTIQCDGPTMMKIQLFGQYMIAGACTHLENQRALVRTRLACVDNNLWLYRGADYVPILDHLWHGAAANGRPILWDDYINSRRAALPVAGID